MTVSRQTEEWLKQNQLTLYNLLSLAFVARRTYEDMMTKQARWLPSLHRLFMVTELEEFRLSDEESQKYNDDKQTKAKVLTDELIASYLIKEWKQTGKLPEEKYLLVTGERASKDKTVLTDLLIRKIKGQSEDIPMAKNNQSTSINGAIIPTGILSIATTEIKTVLESKSGDIDQYRKTNAKELKNLSIIRRKYCHY